MPTKRKNDLINKQKRLIATRLMQISLLVDDYVYQQKPMSQRSAVAYIREISGYKDKIYQDVRSLQVIEKLTRCLNGIIFEQQELNGECVEKDGEYVEKDGFVFQGTSKDDNGPMLSPVYSTADDDLTQAPSLETNDNLLPNEQLQHRPDSYKNRDEIETREVTNESVLLDNAIKEVGTGLIENIATGHFTDKSYAGNTEYPLSSDIEIIDLCNGDDDVEHILSQSNALTLFNEPELNIQNAISNLSVTDLEEPFTLFTQECSQSVLDNYYPTYTCNTNSVRNYVAVPLTHVTKTTIAHQKPATEMVTNNKTAYLLPTIIQKVAPVANIPIVIQSTQVLRNAPKDTEKPKASKPRTKKRNLKNKTNNELPSKTVAKKITAVKTKTTVKVAKEKQKKHSVKANETIPLNNTAVHTTYADETQKKQSYNQYQANNTKKLTYSKTQSALNLNTDNKNKKMHTLPIYNSAVINDLSWIENIRFVREISNEEYQPFTEDEGFWENCTLPKHWNEEDFNY